MSTEKKNWKKEKKGCVRRAAKERDVSAAGKEKKNAEGSAVLILVPDCHADLMNREVVTGGAVFIMQLEDERVTIV